MRDSDLRAEMQDFAAGRRDVALRRRADAQMQHDGESPRGDMHQMPEPDAVASLRAFTATAVLGFVIVAALLCWQADTIAAAILAMGGLR